MSQDATRRSTPNQSPSSRSWQPPFSPESGSESSGLSIESYADRLMDDLFEDVEQALNFGLELAEKPKPVKKRSLSAVPAPFPAPLPEGVPVALSAAPGGIVLPLPVEPNANRLSERSGEHLSGPIADDLSEATPAPEAAPPAPEPPHRPYDRILFGVSCVSIIVSLAIWLMNQEWKRQAGPTPAAVPSPIAPSPPVSADSSQFAEYAQQALQAIGQRAPAASGPVALATPPSTLPNPTLPTVTIPTTPGAPAAPVAPPFRATGRLKMPVSPLPPSVFPSPMAIAPIPAVVPSTVPVPVKPPVPFTAPGLARKLTGIVDMGDTRSAVLIEINGVVQRFRVGESLGSSGWTLVEVSQNQAVIRRNGEVRSIFIGQSF